MTRVTFEDGSARTLPEPASVGEHHFDAVEMDMITRGDMLGPRLGARVATALRHGGERLSRLASVAEAFRTAVNPTTALRVAPPSREEGLREALPIDSAPKDRPILVWWPIMGIDEDSGTLSDRQAGGAWLVTAWNGGYWLEPETLNGLNSTIFDDDREYAEGPTRWLDLPAALSHAEGGE